jgi:hypothetical protein
VKRRDTEFGKIESEKQIHRYARDDTFFGWSAIRAGGWLLVLETL